MKLTVKSLQGGNFTLEAEPADTIASVKAKISSEKGHPVEQQKIIYSGKILTDDQTVEACKITEKGFLVLMVSKPKAAKPEASAPAASSSTSSTASAAPPSEASKPAEASATPATSSTETAQPAATAASATSATSATPVTAAAPAGDASFATGSQLESVIQNMMEMGFERDQIQRALRASYNNPDRAVEYLMNGIPEHLLREQQQPQQQRPQPSSGAGAAGSPPASAAAPAQQPSAASAPAARPGNLFEAAAAAQGGGGARAGGPRRGAGGAGGAGAAAGGEGGGSGLEALLGDNEPDEDGTVSLDLGDPQMVNQLRTLIQENPAALQPLVQAIAQSNPALAQAFGSNPMAVLNLLSNLSQGNGPGSGFEDLLGPQGAGGEEGEEELQLPSFEDLAGEDRTAVEQIEAMGIPREKAIEAYLMCGRNVEMAVQYYFEHESEFQD